MKTKTLCLLLICILGIVAVSFSQDLQKVKETPASTSYKMTTLIPEGIGIPGQVDSRLGTLTFFDGFPDNPTVDSYTTILISRGQCRLIYWAWVRST